MLTGDLGQTAYLALGQHGPGLDDVQLEVLRPVLPMLAGSAESVTAHLEPPGRPPVERKLHGARSHGTRAAASRRVFPSTSPAPPTI